MPENLHRVRVRGCMTDLPDWAVRLLCARGINTPEKAEAFFDPSLSRLNAPEMLPGLETAVEILREIRSRKGKNARFAVYGDYDVDGVVASVIMKEAIETFFGFDARDSGKVRIYIPDRHEEGYGLNQKAVKKLCEEADAIVTVDCGITSVDEAVTVMRWEQTHGERRYLIITDHHKPPEVLPEADALVNPHLPGSLCDPLCGAGVALKIGWKLCGRDFMEGHLDLCALAAVADMVELVGDNRIIVAEGLKRLRAMDPDYPDRPGLAALMRTAGLEEKIPEIDAGMIGFRLAPRLNAAGRLESAMNSVNLLLETDPDRAAVLAGSLEMLNAERQETVEKVREQALDQVREMRLDQLFAIVTAGENWESGVVGLAAGKIAEQFGYPTVCLSIQGGKCVGSARSASGIDLYAALKTCADLFERFGGHRQAAGITMPLANLETFRVRLSDAVRTQMTELGKTELCREVSYDAELSLADVSLDMVSLLECMEPFGVGNPSPRFCFRGCEAASLRRVGRDQAHLQGIFRQGKREVKGICFGGGGLETLEGTVTDLVARVYKNTFRGRVSAELQLDTLRESESFGKEPENGKGRKQEFPPFVSNPNQIDPDGLLAAVLALKEVGEAARSKRLLILCPSEDAAKYAEACLPDAEAITYPEASVLPQSAFQRFKLILLIPGADVPQGNRLESCFRERSVIRAAFLS